MQHGSSSILEAEDSDSDLEDLHHVIKESRQQLQVAECALKKHRKDVMDTGIYIDPSKYVSIKRVFTPSVRLAHLPHTLCLASRIATFEQHSL